MCRVCCDLLGGADAACSALRRLDPTAENFRGVIETSDCGLADLTNMYSTMVDQENRAFLLQALSGFSSLAHRYTAVSKPFVEMMNERLAPEVWGCVWQSLMWAVLPRRWCQCS